MAITTADQWFASAKQGVVLQKASIATAAASLTSLWALAGNPGAGSLAIGNTTTGVVPTDVTAGAPLINAFGGAATGYLSFATYRNSVVGGAILYDRLWHAGSINLNALATTAFASQPAITQRLPGGSFAGLEILLEIATTVSATATTINVTYTNDAGVAGRTTGATASLSGFVTPRVIRMPLQAGDKGVQKIDNVIVGGVVATAGAFNVVLARPLDEFDIRVINSLDVHSWDLTGAPDVYADSCFWLVGQPDSTATGVCAIRFQVING